ncbi:hypothetical protein BKI52_42210 [marine bacterium AO1-C]|nr:hypothetical protein BKI52_42210 [marine bacterium AO1-C]
MSDTKKKIIDIAERLIRTRGYNAFSYKDIAKELNIKNAAIHYHFPAKSDLGIAVIEKNQTNFADQTSGWITLSPAQKLEAFIQIYATSKKNNCVCFVGALGASYDSLPEDMQKSLQNATGEIKQWVEGFLQEGLKDEVFSFKCTTTEMADLVITTLAASLILDKINTRNVFGSVRNALKGVL